MAENPEDKQAAASKIVRNHVLAAIASSAVPIPLLDAGILTGVQLRMLKKLAEHYEVTFSEQRANAIIGSLVGVSAAVAAASLLKTIPGIGQALFAVGGLTLPSASTYALGQVFIKHFSSGGTFLTFDEERGKEEYKEKVAEGKKAVEQSFAGVRP